MAIEYPNKLYPEIEPYHTFHLPVTSLHSLYVEECGNPDGIPVVFLHGGPGGGIHPMYRRFFDPKKYRVILLDQRGCGKSTPFACIEENTTQDLIRDLEKIRNHLGIDQWMVTGGSWGSTLALVYAQAHPSAVSLMLLRGIFMARQSEIDWIYKEGAHMIFPEVWKKFKDHIHPDQQDDLILGYHKLLNSTDEKESLEALAMWNTWESSIAYLYMPEKFPVNASDLPVARIECYYAKEKYFMEENQILNNMNAIKDIPAVLVQGRYDMVCPMINAYDLDQAWPKAKLKVIQDAGHSTLEPGIVHAFIEVLNEYASS